MYTSLLLTNSSNQINDSGPCVEEIFSLIIIFFVEGSAMSANTLVQDCAVVSMNRHLTDKPTEVPYGKMWLLHPFHSIVFIAQNPFFMRDTR